MTMQNVESAVAAISRTQASHAGHVTLQTQIKAIDQRLSAMEEGSAGSSSTTAPCGTLARGNLPIPRMFEEVLATGARGRTMLQTSWTRDDVADFLDTRNVGMNVQIFARHRYEQGNAR